MTGTYGDTLPAMAERIEQIVRNVYLDANNFVRGAVNVKTLRPFTDRDVARYPLEEMYTRNANIPWQHKKLIMNYEEPHMATGDWLRALTHRFAVTGDEQVRDRARKTFEAVCLLCDNSFSTNMLGEGWLPKPYNGIRDVAEMYETSADQYTKITLALELFAREVATKRERQRAHRIIVAFADWWIEHWYTTSYFGRCLWWWRHNSPHAYGREFDLMWEFREGLLNVAGPSGNSMNLGIETCARLWELKPDRRDFWEKALEANWAASLSIADEETGCVVQGPPEHHIIMNTGSRVACSAAAMLRFVSDPGELADWARRYLALMNHSDMFLVEHPSTEHVRPGFWFHENALSGHYYTAWLHAYWKLARFATEGDAR